MMVDDNIQVWLETDARTGNLITPYVQSTQPRTLQYKVRAMKEGPGGRSQVSQIGRVDIKDTRPVALGRFGMSMPGADQCRIELSLLESGELLATYILPCPE